MQNYIPPHYYSKNKHDAIAELSEPYNLGRLRYKRESYQMIIQYFTKLLEEMFESANIPSVVEKLEPGTTIVLETISETSTDGKLLLSDESYMNDLFALHLFHIVHRGYGNLPHINHAPVDIERTIGFILSRLLGKTYEYRIHTNLGTMDELSVRLFITIKKAVA